MRRIDEIKNGWTDPRLNSYNNKTLEEILWLIRRVERLEALLILFKARLEGEAGYSQLADDLRDLFIKALADNDEIK